MRAALRRHFAAIRRLVLPGATGSFYSCPDSPGVSVVGDIDLRALIRLPTYKPTANATIAAKYGAAGHRSWQLVLVTNGTLRYINSANGTAVVNISSTIALPVLAYATVWVRATVDVDNGAAGWTVTFYWSDDGVKWAQLGTPVTTAVVTSIFDSDAVVEIGSSVSGTVTPTEGDVLAFEMRNGIDGAVVASPDFRQQASGSPTFVDDQANTWSPTGVARIAA